MARTHLTNGRVTNTVEARAFREVSGFPDRALALVEVCRICEMASSWSAISERHLVLSKLAKTSWFNTLERASASC